MKQNNGKVFLNMIISLVMALNLKCKIFCADSFYLIEALYL